MRWGLPEYVLLIVALIFAQISFRCLFFPVSFMKDLEVELPTPSALAEIRAVYFSLFGALTILFLRAIFTANKKLKIICNCALLLQQSPPLPDRRFEQNSQTLALVL